MTEEDFLKRWSRRKREAEVAKPIPPEAEAADVDSTATQDAAFSKSANAPQAEFDPATLPSLESITSVTDITAFLRAGVPADLTRAALRRAWTADPAIRDFVGLAENAWDFTDPNAMPGFGPLEMTDEVRRMIAEVVDQIGQAARPKVAEAEPVHTEASENLNDSSVLDASEQAGEAPRQVVAVPDQTAGSRAEELGSQVLLHSSKEDDAVQRDLAEESKNTKQLSHRIHGTALPR